jgi:hypothetical protein
VVTGGNRFLSIGAAAGSLALLAAVVLMLWPPDPGDYAFTPGRDRPDGETVGWVSKVEANTIHVNSGPFGGGVVPLVVTKSTRITVGAKDGWFEDIRPGGQVKVAYELYHGRRFARSVELLVDEGSRRPVRAAPQVKAPADAPAPAVEARPMPAPAPAAQAAAPPVPAPPATATAPPVVVPPAAAPPAKAPPVAAPPAVAPKVAAPAPVAPPPAVVAPAPPRPVPATAKPAPAPEIRPAPRPEPAPARPQPAEIVPPPQRASTSTSPARNVSAPENGARTPEPARAVEAVRPPAPAASRPAEPARGTESEATDGSAAVDWLLKRR